METDVPILMSLEGRANMIADEAGRIEHVGKPAERREAVRMAALNHLRMAVAHAIAGHEVE